MKPEQDSGHCVIVHVHLFKNAGSTFDWSLKRNFGSAFIDHREDDKMRKGADYLGPYLRQWQPKALSSHHIMLPLPEIPGMTLLPVFMLRHPMDRLGSVYAFEKKQKANTKGAIKAKEMPFAEFIRWYMQPGSPATVRDFQVRRCSGKTRAGKPLEPTDYQEALKTLGNSPLVGIVEAYDESMIVFEDVLRNYFPGMDLSYKKQNVGKRQSETLEQRVAGIEAALGDDLVNLVMENNQYDFMLYEAAKKMLHSRMSEIADFDARLKDFHNRIESLQQGVMPVNPLLGASHT